MPYWSLRLLLVSFLLLLPLKDQQESLTEAKNSVTNRQSLTPNTADPAPSGVTEADQAIIRLVIEQQLAAFGKDDAASAFAFASPSIQAQFSTAENFLAMVKSTYPPVYRPRSVEFEEFTTIDGIPAQKVVLQGPDGELTTAVYVMEKQPDGKWRISGCVLVPMVGESV